MLYFMKQKRDSFLCQIVLLTLLGSGSAAADEPLAPPAATGVQSSLPPQVPATTHAAPQSSPQTTSYGYWAIAPDLAAIGGILVVPFVRNYGENKSALGITIPLFALYTFPSPFIHLAHRNIVGAAISLAFRGTISGLTQLGMGLSDKNNEVGAAGIGALSAFVFSFVDWLALSRTTSKSDPANEAVKPTWQPRVAAGPRGLEVGLWSSF